MQEKEAQDKMEEDAKGLEKMASKEVLLQEKIQESLDKIAALGTLPNAPELHSKYQKMSLKQVRFFLHFWALIFGTFRNLSILVLF